MIKSIRQIGKVTQNKTNFAAMVMGRFTRKAPFCAQNQERGTLGIVENEEMRRCGDVENVLAFFPFVFSILCWLSSRQSRITRVSQAGS